jgi:hypothetical protein
MLAELPDQAIDELVMTAGEHAGSPLLRVDLRQLGGALAHAPATAGALGKLNGAFAMTAIGMAIDEPMGAAVDAHLALLTDALTAWDAGTRYLNFVERHGNPAHPVEPDAYRRLCEIKAAHDPTDLFRGNHPIATSR